MLFVLILLSAQSYSQDNFGIERVKLFHNSWTSNGFRHQIVDDYVFLLKSDRYSVLDLTNPENVTEIGTYWLQNRGNGDFKIVDDRLYHAHAEGLSLYDISNFETPNHLQMIEREGGYTALAQRDTILFACSSDSVLQIFNINHDFPRIISEMDINGQVGAIAINNDVIFLGGERLHIINIGDIDNPVLLSETDVIVKDMEFFESHVLIAADEDGIFLYDIGDMENPEVVWSIAGRRIQAWIMIRYHEEVYIAQLMQEWDDLTWLEWLVLDLSDIDNPRRLDCRPCPSISGYAFEYGDYLCFTTNGDRFNGQRFGYYIYSVENGFPPDSVGVYYPVQGMSLAAIENDILYAFESRDRRQVDLYVLDIRNPENPQTISSLRINNENLSGYNGELYDNRLYLESRGPYAIYCIDVDDPENPSLINPLFETQSSVTSIFPSEFYLYSTFWPRGLMITPMPLDGENERWFIEEINSPQDIAVYNNWAYVSTWDEGVRIVDVSDRQNPFTRSRINRQGHVRCVEVSNDRLYIADGNLAVYSLDDPIYPELLMEYNPVDTVYDFHLYSDYVIARTARRNGRDPQIRIFDISDIENPEIVGQYFIRDDQRLQLGSMEIDPPYVYMAHQSCIGVYDCSAALKVVGNNNTETPSVICLQPAYPNPFNSSTRVNYSVPFSMDIEIGIFNLQGRQIKVLERGMKPAGQYNANWDSEGFESGMYFIRLKDKGGYRTQQETKVVLLK